MAADGEKLHMRIVAGKTLSPLGFRYDCFLNVSCPSYSEKVITYSLQVDVLVPFVLAIPVQDI